MKSYLIQFALFICVLFLMPGRVWGQTTSPTDYFRSNSATGSWNAASSWESSSNGSSNWITATMVPTETANVIAIRNGHTITINSNTTVDQVVVANGGTLELATGTSTGLTVNDGTGNDIVVQAGGELKHNITGSSLPSFSGSATIEFQTGGTLEIASNSGAPSNYATTSSSISGNIIWADSSIFNWNAATSPLDGVTYFPSTPNIPIFRVSRAISFGNSTATVINGLLEANATVTLLSSGFKTFRNGVIGTGTVSSNSGTGGRFIINGATARLGGGTLGLNSSGLTIASGTTVNLTSNKSINNVSGGSGTLTLSGILICDDYLIDGSGKIQIDGTLKTTNANGLAGSTNTTFVSPFTVNSLGSASIVEYSRTGNQTVTPLSYANLNISGSGTKTAGLSADILVSGTLNISSANTFALNGINNLKLNGGGIVNINANATFDNGGESQVSGSSNPAINISGTFITRDTEGFTGTNASIPGTTSTITVNINAGSTIEYGKAGDQQVTSRNDYKNITFSGSGTKILATFTPVGTVTIKDNAIADAANKTFGDSIATHLTMTGGRFIVAGSSTKPDIAGTYNLTGGVIEFAGGTSSSRQNIRSTPTYLNIEVSGLNVGNSSSSTKLADGGSFTVKNKGSYENSGDKIDGATGIQTFIMEAGATFKTGAISGFSGSVTNTPYPALNSIENITIDPKSTIVYSRGGDQTITPLPAGYPTLLLKGSGIKTLSSGTLTIAATADSVVIDPLVILKVSSGAKANFNNRPVTVHSSASGTGFIGEITDGSSALLNANNVTVERYIPARRAFRFLSAPVTTSGSIKANWMEGQSNPAPAYSVNNNNSPGYGTHITGSSDPSNGFDATATNNPSLFTFNNSNQAWEAVPNTSSTLIAGNGYRLFVRGSRSVDLSNNSAAPSNTILRAAGSLRTGLVIYNTTSSPSISGSANYYSLIGNPFASPVDWDALVKPGLSSYYYVWDPNLNTRGAYVTYGNGVTSTQSSQVNQNIQSGQAFFVQTKTANPSLTFNETNKTTINRYVFRSAATFPKLSVQLLLDTTGESEQATDGITAFFDDNFTDTIGGEDAAKINNLDETMSIISKETLLSIEGRPTVIASDSIQLHIVQYRQKKYCLKFDPINFLTSTTASVKDNFLQKETIIDLNSVTLIPFDITGDSASFAANRFIIKFKTSKVLPLIIDDIKAYKKEAGIQVEWGVATEKDIEKYEVEKSTDGRQFVKRATVAARQNGGLTINYSWYDRDVNIGSNFYRIKCIYKTGLIFYSTQARININETTPSISISPNPIQGNQINLRMKNLKKGNYTVSVFNNNGQSIYTTVINYKGTIESFKLSCEKVTIQGAYKVQISNGEKTIVENVLFE